MSIRKEQKEGSAIIYLIDEENRTVTAKIPTKNLLEGALNDCGKYSLVSWRVYETIENYPHTYFVGTAKCAPEDTFDIETGKRLAAARMFKKYYKTKLMAFNKVAIDIDNDLTSCEDLMNYSWLAFNKFADVEKEILKVD